MAQERERLLRADFFRFLFGEQVGWLCIATESAVKGDFRQRFFEWPAQESQMLTHIAAAVAAQKNVWFCTTLLSKKERVKSACKPGYLLWADLDDCNPDIVDPKPQLVIESSPDRYQAIWRVDSELTPDVAEDYNRRIYGQYRDEGVDSQWYLTKLLRVPATLNVKPDYDRPEVKLLRAVDEKLPVQLFDALSYRHSTLEDELEDSEVPELEDPEPIIIKHQYELKKRNFPQLWTYTPEANDDWSKRLWHLIMVCVESGLSKEETFSIAHASNVNKYKRDGRPIRYLWREVTKAFNQSKVFDAITGSTSFEMPEIIPGEKYKLGMSFVERYIAWGKEATDAPYQYHELGAFMLLSSLLAGNLRFETSYGSIRPNLWGLILGESTLDRKTTAMGMARDAIDFIDRSILLATDGSAEGIVTALEDRAGKTSLFYRDEVVGLFDSIRKKDWLAGIPQLFTQLYDGTPVRRLLRKETIAVDNPVFLFFGGGIKDQFFVSVEESFVYSGFLPRFLIVSSHTDVSRLRRMGPPTPELIEKRQEIYNWCSKLWQSYMVVSEVIVLGQAALEPIDTVIEMTKEGYDLYGEIEERMVEAALKSPNQGLALPTFERLSRSLLKMAMLVAATRQVPDDYKITMDQEDILRAAKFVQEWGAYSVETILNVGQSATMRQIDRVYAYIVQNPGVTRSTVMRSLNLTKRQIQEIEDTLDARGHIKAIVQGRGKIYEPMS